MPFKIVAAALVAACLWLAPPAGAIVSDVAPIDGPSADVLELGGAAMSEDGSGGVVYLERTGGRAHVFAAQFVNGGWSAPQQVDRGQSFDSSWPRIAAGDGGRLVVVWVQEGGAGTDRLYSAALDPGASTFQPPVLVDPNVGDATGTFPSIEMARGGQAYMAYRVITDTGSSNPPGYVGADTRVARYSGDLWSVFGSPADRNPAVPVRTPTATNSPRVALDIQGGAIVAFQEPGDDFVDRIWARRIFGSSYGIPLQVSPSQFAGAPLRGGVDAFDLDVSGFGQGAVALRQRPGDGGRLGATRVFVNQIPDLFAQGSGAFVGAQPVDGSPRAPGPPSVSVTPDTTFASAFSSSSATLLAEGDEAGGTGVRRLDTGASSIPGDPQVDLSESGAAVAAWREASGGRGYVSVLERRADGVPELSQLTAPRGGAVNGLALAGSGRGDAIVAFHQGGASFGQVAAAVVDAPPNEFLVLLPEGWQRKRRVPIAWEAAQNSGSRVTYTVSVDDEPVQEGIRGTSATLSRDDIENGSHRIQIFAVDAQGQETGSKVSRLRVDRARPRVRLRRRGRRITVRVSDGISGLSRRRVSIAFGDGRRRARVARASYVYGRGGSFRLVVRARDRAGNRLHFRKWVRVP